MRLLKPVDYKLNVLLIINTCSMLEFQLRKHNKSCIGITWRDLRSRQVIRLIREVEVFEVFDRSAELSIVTGSNLDPKKYLYVTYYVTCYEKLM